MAVIPSMAVIPLSPMGEEGMLIRAALREKVPNVLSRCHTKRRMDG